MKQSSKTALGGIVSALSVTLMLMTGVIPFMTYALPLAAGSLLILVVIEINKRWAFVVYAAVSLMSIFVVTDKEAAVEICRYISRSRTPEAKAVKLQLSALMVKNTLLCRMGCTISDHAAEVAYQFIEENRL